MEPGRLCLAVLDGAFRLAKMPAEATRPGFGHPPGRGGRFGEAVPEADAAVPVRRGQPQAVGAPGQGRVEPAVVGSWRSGLEHDQLLGFADSPDPDLLPIDARKPLAVGAEGEPEDRQVLGSLPKRERSTVPRVPDLQVARRAAGGEQASIGAEAQGEDRVGSDGKVQQRPTPGKLADQDVREPATGRPPAGLEVVSRGRATRFPPGSRATAPYESACRSTVHRVSVMTCGRDVPDHHLVFDPLAGRLPTQGCKPAPVAVAVQLDHRARQALEPSPFGAGAGVVSLMTRRSAVMVASTSPSSEMSARTAGLSHSV